MSLNDLRGWRMRTQRLAPRAPREALVEVVKALCGVQAQLSSAMELALRARVTGLTAEDIRKSREDDRSLILTWCMRGSMHLLAADDLDELLSAIAPAVLRDARRWFERKHGLEKEQIACIQDEVYRLLKANGAMTRRDLLRAVAEQCGAAVEAAAYGAVRLNAMLGKVCFGADRGGEATYVALDDWVGRSVLLAEANYAELARRYLQGYGPAEPRDLAEWWGLSLTEAKKAWAALEGELSEVTVEGQSLWRLSTDVPDSTDSSAPGHIVRLLPAFDTHLLGYHTRDAAVPAVYRKRVFHGGQVVPVVLVDGCAAGAWRYERRGKRFRVTVEPFTSFTPEVRELIAEEADDIGRFYDLTADLHFA